MPSLVHDHKLWNENNQSTRKNPQKAYIRTPPTLVAPPCAFSTNHALFAYITTSFWSLRLLWRFPWIPGLFTHNNYCFYRQIRMMSSHCKRPASPSHCTRYVHATKRPRFALQDSSLLEIRIRKRKYSEDVCESCLNNRRAEKAYCTKEILHNTYRSAGRNATSSDSGSFHCINFQADTNVANNLDLGHIDGIRSITDTEIKSRKKQRIYPPDTMQIIYKVRSAKM